MSRTTSELAARIARASGAKTRGSSAAPDRRFVSFPSGRFVRADADPGRPGDDAFPRPSPLTSLPPSVAAMTSPSPRATARPSSGGRRPRPRPLPSRPSRPAPRTRRPRPPPRSASPRVAAENKGPSVERALKSSSDSPRTIPTSATRWRASNAARTARSPSVRFAARKPRSERDTPPPHPSAREPSSTSRRHARRTHSANADDREDAFARARASRRRKRRRVRVRDPSPGPRAGRGARRSDGRGRPPANRAAERSSARDVSPAPDDVSPDVAPPSPDYSGGAYGKTTDPAFAGSIVPGARRSRSPARAKSPVPIEDRPPWDSSPAKAPPRNRSRSTSRSRSPGRGARAASRSRSPGRGSSRVRVGSESPARARTSVSAREGRRASPRHPAKQRPAGRRRCRRCRRFGVAETSPGPGSERVRRRVVPRGRVRRREPARVARRAAPRRLRGGDERVSGEDSGVGGRARRGPFESPRVSRRRSAKRRRERCRAQSGDATGGGGDWPGG